MVIGIIGENCSGKSTLAVRIQEAIGAEIITGKDYLRTARSASEAGRLFRERLKAAVDGSNIIYVISEPDQLGLLPEGSVRILVRADLDTIKKRFRERMRGTLPAPVEKMLERKHGMFDGVPCDLRFDGAEGDPAALCGHLVRRRASGQGGRDPERTDL
ncbi:MAG: hypothetical protein IJH78_05160 [Clostridia bacterium]|nr:hypothetical protein [Clostridia bacterium]